MPEAINQLAQQIASQSEETLNASLRFGVITEIEASGSLRVRVDTTGAAWLTRDRSTTFVVGDRVWIIRQATVWMVGGRLSGGEATPIGSVQAFAGATAPSGWLACDGSAVSRTTYAALYAVIGTTYGSGDGSTTFNVPNLTNRMAVGSGGTYSRGTTGGAATVTLTSGQVPAHDHGSAGAHTHTTDAYTTDTRSKTANLFNTLLPAVSGTVTTSSAGAHTHASFGGGGSHENMSPFLAMPMLIRAL